MRRILPGFGFLLLLLFSVIVGCGDRDDPNSDSAEVVIGASFATLAEERWSREQELMQKAADALSAQGAAGPVRMVFQSADGDEARQNDQIENLITQGVDALIIIAQNSEAAATAVAWADKEGIPCVAYDRFISSPELDLYISFDSVKVGERQAQALVERVPEGGYLWLGGSPTDDNAHRVRQGHMNVLDPLIKAGRISLKAEQWCDGWRPEEALKHTENALTATRNRIDAVLASNDGTAGAAIQALEAQELSGRIPVSGQDAELAACQRIASGTQTVTIFKDVRILAGEAVAAAVELAGGRTPDKVNSQVEGVDAILLDVIPVTGKNLYEVIVKSGYHGLEEVYRHIPRDQWPKSE
ncbi:MAG: sugar ABC transporter substrate-binding protein [Planctomycetota bacterium]